MSKHDDTFQMCLQCTKPFKNVGEHLKSCRKAKQEKHFACHHCDKTFASKKCLKVHIQAKHLTTPGHTCCCGKIFGYRASLNRHKKKCQVINQNLPS
jgi:hypothetical protein